MNITGDPNQRNKPVMFGFEDSYPNTTLNLSRFNEEATGVSSPTTMEDPSQRLFAMNNSSPFPVNNTPQPTASVPFNSGYVFSSTSFLNQPPSVNRFTFPFPQTSAPVQTSKIFPETSTVTGSPNPFHSNWTSSMKSEFAVPANLLHLPSTSNGITARPFSGTFGCKRKTESPPLPPLKQHITEERMAEHMSRLHISSQTPASSEESQPIRERRLYMCEEMQRLQNESIIPAQILERVNRPCTALVPWRPPVVPQLSRESNNNEEEPDSNIREQQLQNNVMDMDS